MQMEWGAAGPGGVVEFKFDLTTHHLTHSEEKALEHHVKGLGYVDTKRTAVLRHTLFVVANMGRLQEETLVHAVGTLVSRVEDQLERCKAKPVRLVRS